MFNSLVNFDGSPYYDYLRWCFELISLTWFEMSKTQDLLDCMYLSGHNEGVRGTTIEIWLTLGTARQTNLVASAGSSLSYFEIQIISIRAKCSVYKHNLQCHKNY